jgi:hypothetical protein
VLGLELFEPADPGTDDHPCSKGIDFGEIQAGIVNSFSSSYQSKLRHPVDTPSLLGTHVSGGIKTRQLPTYMAGESAGVKTTYGHNSTCPCAEPIP